MSHAHFQTPRNFIHPLLSRASMDKVQFEHFSLALQTYLQALELQVQTKQSEPNMVTNALKPFMEQLGYFAQGYIVPSRHLLPLLIIPKSGYIANLTTVQQS